MQIIREYCTVYVALPLWLFKSSISVDLLKGKIFFICVIKLCPFFECIPVCIEFLMLLCEILIFFQPKSCLCIYIYYIALFLMWQNHRYNLTKYKYMYDNILLILLQQFGFNNNNNKFAVNPSSGWITVNERLDYETQNFFPLVIMAKVLYGVIIISLHKNCLF